MRKWRILVVALLVSGLAIAGTGLARADHDGSDDWITTDDDWYDDGGTPGDDWYDDDWTPGDDWYDDDWTPGDDTFGGPFDDEWYDDGWTPGGDWYDDGYDDDWYEPEITEDAVTGLLDAIDDCVTADDALSTCVLAAIDALFLDAFDDLPMWEDDWYDDGWTPDDEWSDDDWFDDGWTPDDEWSDDDWYDDGSFGDDGFFDDELEPVDDPATEAAIRQRFEELIPVEWRDRIDEVSLETDGRDGVVAAVEPLSDDLTSWALLVDPADADFELDHTLVHEFAHVMTLNESQIDAQIVWSDQEYEAAAAACPTYFSGEGCAKTGSYLAGFVDRFWAPLLDEFESINSIEDEFAWQDAMFSFYDDHADQFVSDYAATNPGEDIAESFAAYVLAPELPKGDTVAEQKILFFGQFPELAQLRDSIRRAL